MGYASRVLGEDDPNAQSALEPRIRTFTPASLIRGPAAQLGKDGDQLLEGWRENLLKGVLATSTIALIPPLLIQGWQALQGVSGTISGWWLALAAFVTLATVTLLPLRYRLRSALLLAIGYLFTTSAILIEGLAPAQFVAVCMLITLCVLLRSTLVALWMLSGIGLTMAAAAHLFSHGIIAPNALGHVDVTKPLNWLRVGLFTVFPSATMAVATSYLLDKLHETVRLRTILVRQLSDEVDQRELALAELERTQARLVQAQKLEAIGQLAAGIAHDFNNTLSVVALEAELLRHKSQGNADVARGADSLIAAAERGTQLSRQLLLFGRTEPTEREVLDAARQVEECVRTLQRLVPSEITFDIDLSKEALPVRMLASELQQIVLNLGINARDAMPSGGVLRLAIEHRQLDVAAASRLGLSPGAYALLTCRDTGAGMDAATLARAFEPFFTTKSSGRGTGLGLTNVWNIARRAGGTVDLQSAAERGTTLWVYLPIANAPVSILPEPRPSMLQGRETVLVVEDDIRIRALLVTVFVDAGYTVLDAANADAALALEREHAGAIELLCTDVVMPGRPARELIAELRDRRPQIAILVCSGYSEDEQIARGIERGELMHLAKPFTRKALLTKARAVLEAATSRSRLGH